MERNRADHTPESATLTPSEQKASQAIQQVAQASHPKLESLLGVGTTRAVMLLKRLVGLDKVRKIGNGKNTKYQCKGPRVYLRL